MRLFFYGTLLDSDVRLLVLGPGAAAMALTPALLPGWQRRKARGRSYPIILRDPAGTVDGAVTSPLDAAAVAKLSAYEGPGYTLNACQVTLSGGSAVAAHVYQPTERLAADDAAWDLADWQLAEKSKFLERLRRGAGHG